MKTSTSHFTAGMIFAGHMLLAGPADAQWRVAQESPNGSGKRIDVAIVENDSGHSLRLFHDETRNVRGIFTIRGGFDTIDPRTCPTYRIDKREPSRVSFEEGRCRVLAKQAEFTLGNTALGPNRQLNRIMNGSSIVFRYRLGAGRYRETIFSLRGSKFAVLTAVKDLEVSLDE